MFSEKTIRWGLKPLVFIISSIPFFALIWGLFFGQLGVNPVEVLTHSTGEWSLRFLLISLVMTPLRHLTGSSIPVRFRRMLGLYAFFYLVLHFFIYIYLDHQFSVQFIWEDIKMRNFIAVGFLSFLVMIPLAATSFRTAQRKLGKRWVQLHKTVYVCAILGLLHFVWLVKADYNEVTIYVAVFLLLMVFRVYRVSRRRLAQLRT